VSVKLAGTLVSDDFEHFFSFFMCLVGALEV
jgi:hypothetical protein